MVTMLKHGLWRAPRGSSPCKLKSRQGWTALLVQSVTLCLLYHADTFTHLARVLNHSSCAPEPDAFHAHLAAGLRAQFPDFPCADRPTDSPTPKQLLYLLARSYATHAAYFKPPVLSLPESWCSINVVLTWLYTAALVVPPLRRRLSPSLQAAWLNACLLNDLFVPSICWGLLGSAPPSCVPHYTPSTCEALGYTALVGLPAWMVYLIAVYVTGSLSVVSLLLAKHGLVDQVPYSLPSLWVRQVITVVAVVAFTSLRGRIWSALLRMMTPPATQMGVARPPALLAAPEAPRGPAPKAVTAPPAPAQPSKPGAWAATAPVGYSAATSVRNRRRDVATQLSEAEADGSGVVEPPPPQRLQQQRFLAAATRDGGAAAENATTSTSTEGTATVAAWPPAFVGGGAVADGSSCGPRVGRSDPGVGQWDPRVDVAVTPGSVWLRADPWVGVTHPPSPQQPSRTADAAGGDDDAGPLAFDAGGSGAAAPKPPQPQPQHQQQQQEAGPGANCDGAAPFMTGPGGEMTEGRTGPEQAAALQAGSGAGLPTSGDWSRGPSAAAAPAAAAVADGGPAAAEETPPGAAKEAAAPPLTIEELHSMVAAARAAPYRSDPTVQLTRVHLRLSGVTAAELPPDWQQTTVAWMNRRLPLGYAVLGLTAMDTNPAPIDGATAAASNDGGDGGGGGSHSG
ncbi:hypothetical protein PLESTF_000325500 [Pleodorina starrii]|nr:hypothetical protein PLESTF_000325500 [Pleodorina starrii]